MITNLDILAAVKGILGKRFKGLSISDRDCQWDIKGQPKEKPFQRAIYARKGGEHPQNSQWVRILPSIPHPK
jgi:hypothetical protein